MEGILISYENGWEWMRARFEGVPRAAGQRKP